MATPHDYGIPGSDMLYDAFSSVTSSVSRTVRSGFMRWKASSYAVDYSRLKPASDAVQQRVNAYLKVKDHNEEGFSARIWKLQATTPSEPGLAIKAARVLVPEKATKKPSAELLKQQAIMQQELEREAGILQQISHPHIISFLGAYENPDEGCTLVMELMNGDLADLIQKAPDFLSLQTIAQIGHETIQALAWMHNTRALVHGDVHDGNVFYKPAAGSQLIFKLGDLGVCQKKGTPRKNTDVPHMPPEVSTVWKKEFPKYLVAKPKAHPANDIWAFGAMLTRLLTYTTTSDLKLWLRSLGNSLLGTSHETEARCMERIAVKVNSIRAEGKETATDLTGQIQQLITTCSGCQHPAWATRPTASQIEERLAAIRHQPAKPE